MPYHQYVFLFLPIYFLSTIQCAPTSIISPDNCLSKLNKMKNVLHNIKLEQKKFGNVTIANMELFYEMCTDTTSCIEEIVMPDVLKGLLGIGTMFLRSACDEYGFSVGPFSKCIEKTKFDLTTLKNTTATQPKPKCELSTDEFSELQRFIQKECGDDVVTDMMNNENRVKSLLCTDN